MQNPNYWRLHPSLPVDVRLLGLGLVTLGGAYYYYNTEGGLEGMGFNSKGRGTGGNGARTSGDASERAGEASLWALQPCVPGVVVCLQ